MRMVNEVGEMNFNIDSDEIENGSQIQKQLERVFQKLKIQFKKMDVENIRPDVVKKSHVKYILYEKEIGEQRLTFELIRFLPGIFTGPHTHPAYMVDSILYGKLKEVRYQKVGEIFRIDSTLIRSEGESRSIYCPDLFPHNVMAIEEECLSLCLSFGEDFVKGIEVA